MEEIDDTEIYEVEKIIGARRVKSKFEEGSRRVPRPYRLLSAGRE